MTVKEILQTSKDLLFKSNFQNIKVYVTHWSDNHKSWSTPTETDNLDLGLPFGYFLAENDEEARKFVIQNLTDKPLTALRPKNYFPIRFHLGRFPIEVIQSSKKKEV